MSVNSSSSSPQPTTERYRLLTGPSPESVNLQTALRRYYYIPTPHKSPASQKSSHCTEDYYTAGMTQTLSSVNESTATTPTPNTYRNNGWHGGAPSSISPFKCRDALVVMSASGSTPVSRCTSNHSQGSARTCASERIERLYQDGVKSLRARRRSPDITDPRTRAKLLEAERRKFCTFQPFVQPRAALEEDGGCADSRRSRNRSPRPIPVPRRSSPNGTSGHVTTTQTSVFERLYDSYLQQKTTRERVLQEVEEREKAPRIPTITHRRNVNVVKSSSSATRALTPTPAMTRKSNSNVATGSNNVFTRLYQVPQRDVSPERVVRHITRTPSSSAVNTPNRARPNPTSSRGNSPSDSKKIKQGSINNNMRSLPTTTTSVRRTLDMGEQDEKGKTTTPRPQITITRATTISKQKKTLSIRTGAREGREEDPLDQVSHNNRDNTSSSPTTMLSPPDAPPRSTSSPRDVHKVNPEEPKPIEHVEFPDVTGVVSDGEDEDEDEDGEEDKKKHINNK
eukprot:PhM_4_TR4101/c0_g1_i1/m.99075